MTAKRFFLCLLVLLSAGITEAQFPQVAQFSTKVQTIRSLGSGVKLIEDFTPTASTCTIYNQDLSVFRVLHYPAAPAGSTWGNMGYITEELFDTDPSTIEFTLQAYGGTGGNGLFVYREDGTQLFEQIPGEMLSSAGAFLSSFEPIYTYNGQSYMLLYDASSAESPTRIYALPGTLPCMDCYGSPGVNGILGGMNIPDPGTQMMLFPNPTGQSTTLMLGGAKADVVTLWDTSGKIVRTQDAGKNSSVTLSLSGLAAGTYTVSVEQRGHRIASLPLVVKGE